MACPANGLQSFPIEISGFSPSRELYNSVIEPLNFSLNWGTSTDIPEFSQAASVQSGELFHESFNSTKLTYNSATYTLLSVQITTNTHSNWLSLTTSEAINTNNQEDIILTFINTVDSSPNFIILVNPIIRIDRPIQSSAFLTAFANQTLASVGPASLFPNISTQRYAYYTTCSKLSSVGLMNTLVVINIQGLLVWKNIIDSIKSKYNTQRGISFPNYVPAYYGMFSATPTTITNQIMFKSNVLVSKGYSSSIQTPPKPIQQIVTDSYKCVPFNPETDISGGALYIDSTTGTPMTNEIARRQKEKDEYNSKYASKIPFTIIEKYTKIFTIIVFSVVFLFIIIYAILSLTAGESQMGTGATMLKLALANILKVPVYIVIAFFCTFIGLFVGLSLAPSNNKDDTEPPATTGSLSGLPTTTGSPSGLPTTAPTTTVITTPTTTGSPSGPLIGSPSGPLIGSPSG